MDVSEPERGRSRNVTIADDVEYGPSRHLDEELRSDSDSMDSRVLHAKEIGVSTTYDRQIVMLNKAIKEEIGFGKFQLKVTLLAGCGWLADNIWFEILTMTLPRIKDEFKLQDSDNKYATLSLYSGLLIGSTFWGLCSDIIGRRPSWNMSLFLSAVFGIAVGGAYDLKSICILLGCLGLGLGGNLPVDGAMLIEYIPGSHQWILTFLSLFWCIGQLFAALIGWAFIATYHCADSDNCPKSENWGWRYAWFLLGGVVMLMFVARFFIYPIPESPKFLLATGREDKAYEVLQFIAKENGKTTSLTLEQLRSIKHGRTERLDAANSELRQEPNTESKEKFDEATMEVRDPKTIKNAWLTAMTSESYCTPKNIRQTFRCMHRSPFSALFASPKMAINTTIICLLWGMIGLAYPLFNSYISIYINQVDPVGTSLPEQYRQLVEIAACGIPGSFFAAAMAELPYMGRKGCMALFTVLTGIFLFLFTTAGNASAVLGWNCAVSLTQNAMYAVLYAITYEVFPAPQRGTGDGLSMSVQRIFGVVATVVAKFGPENFKPPVYVSGSLYLVASVLMLLLPYEPRGKSAL